MFRKTARVASLGTFDVEGDGQIRIAQRLPEDVGQRASHFLDGARRLNIRDLLERTAEMYAVSRDPSDYFFEAIRANTTGCPNENNDGFHQDELLRFDVKLGMPVYYTYSGKPHLVNHRSENPKAARGVVIDAHYNTDAPPLETCPGCSARTAERQNRDRTGLHCKKCGTLVRDEFVEILVGIDARKDPAFAEGVRKGQLKSGSMGCSCLSTTCNVCAHVAYARPEFCEHIRAGNKGTLWVRKGNAWQKVSSTDLTRELHRRKVAHVPRDFCFVTLDGFEARKAFEYCNQVVFDEYSRVDQPADPKALQVEILRAASLGATADADAPSTDILRTGTEELIRSAEKKEREAHVARMTSTATRTTPSAPRVAQRVPGRAPPTQVPPRPAPLAPEVGPGYVPPADTLADPSMDPMAMDQHGVGIQLEPGDDPVVIEPPDTGMPGGMGPDQMGPEGPGGPTGIDQYTDQEVAPPGGPGQPPPDEEMDMGEMGVLPVPPGASAPPRRGGKMRKYSAAYGAWRVQVSEHGNARILTGDRVPVFVLRATRAMHDEEERKTFGLEVLGQLLDTGLVATAKKYGAYFSPKFASVVDHARDDMKEFSDKQMVSSPIDGATNDMQGDVRGSPPSKTTDDDQDDMDGDLRGSPPDGTQTDGVMDHEREDQGVDSAVGEDHETMREKRKPVSVGKNDVLSGETHDHTEPLSGKKGERAETPSEFAIVGKRIARKDDPKKVPFVVRSVVASIDEDEARMFGPNSFIVAAKRADGTLEQHRIAASSLLDQWRLLDKGSAVTKLPSQPAIGAAATPVRAAAEKCGKCSKLMFGGADKHTCASADADADDSAKKDAAARSTSNAGAGDDATLVRAKLAQAERMEKVAAAKLAQAKEQLAQAKIVADEQAKTIAAATVQSFARALRIAAARQGADLEQSPLKLAAEAVLSEPRSIGRDAATGDPIEYAGFDPELTRFLVAQIYTIGHADHLEQLVKRASELMSKGDQYLVDAEADLRNIAPALPEITHARVARMDEDALHAAEMRRRARGGNPQFTPSPSEAPANGHDRRGAIRGALGDTLVGAVRGRLGLN